MEKNVKLMEKKFLAMKQNSQSVLCKFLKLVSAIFYQIFIFAPNDSRSKIMKKALFVLQISVIFSLPFQTFQIQKNKWKRNNL